MGSIAADFAIASCFRRYSCAFTVPSSS